MSEEMGDSCFICGDDNENRLQTHHLVPRRFGGSDRNENLVVLCASCHQAIEKLYDDSFYRRLGVEKPTEDGSIEIEEFDEAGQLNDGDIVYLRSKNQFYRYDVTIFEDEAWTVEDKKRISFEPIPNNPGRLEDGREFPSGLGIDVEALVESSDVVRVKVHGPLIETLERVMEKNDAPAGD